jgi:two-component system chemotaxis response regulator CheB
VRIHLNQDPPQHSCRPSADVLFRSAAELYGPSTLGVVLTGMGQDGLRGSECIAEMGGQIIVQDEASSVVWGMPGFVAKAGLADAIVPLNHLFAEIEKRVTKARNAPSLNAAQAAHWHVGSDSCR